MSNQQQETAEKCVQTQDSTGHIHLINSTENATTEVANTLVSMATGRQRAAPTIKQSNGISVPNQSPSLPILSLADFTTSRGVPTASALANQAKLTGRKQENMIENHHDDTSMSIDENSTRKKSHRGKKSNMKTKDLSAIDAIQYGPISVKPRKRIAPTLSSGRKSKDEQLPPEDDLKRRLRRDRNKQAAAKCRRRRNDLREQLEKTEKSLVDQRSTLQNVVDNLINEKQNLEFLLTHHACLRKTHLPTTISLNPSRTDVKTIPMNSLLDSTNSKRVTINLANAQDLFALTPLTRSASNTENSSSSSSTNVPMITIHIIPEVAQALLGSTSVDRAKLLELLQQANIVGLTQTSSTTATNNNNSDNTHVPSDTMNSIN